MKIKKVFIYLLWLCCFFMANIGVAEKNTKPLRILTLDSGGIHGVVSTYALRYLEEKSAKPIDKQFDLIVCVSTGSIQAAMLTMPNAQRTPQYSANDLLDYYNTQVASLLRVPLWWKMISLNGLIRPALNSTSIYNAVGSTAKNLKLSDLLNHVIFVAYDLESNQIVLLDNIAAKKDPSKDFMLQDVIYGAISAPTQIGPRQIYSIDGKTRYTLVDGAVMATDPAMIAFALASKEHPNRSKYILSLGDGANPPQIDVKQVGRWGALEWMGPIFHVLLNSRTVLTQDMLQKLYQDKKINLNYYVRVDPVLPSDVANIFDSSPNKMQLLNQVGKSIPQEYKKQLDFFA